MRYLLSISILFIAHTMSAQENLVLNAIQKDSVRFYIGFQKVNEEFTYLQAAQKFYVEKAGSLLERADLGRLIISVNSGQSRIDEPAITTFLLHVYDEDTLSGGPGVSIINEPLEVKNRSNQIITIDLLKHKIRIPGKTFFVAIEWILNSKNQRLMDYGENIELVPGKSFKKTALIYQPFIGMVNNKKATSDAWMMTRERKWILYTHNMPEMTDLAISAHLSIN